MSEPKYWDLMSDSAKAEWTKQNERFTEDHATWRREDEERRLDLSKTFAKAIEAAKDKERRALNDAIEAAKAEAERKVRDEYAVTGKASVALENTAKAEAWAAFTRQVLRDVRERNEQ